MIDQILGALWPLIIAASAGVAIASLIDSASAGVAHFKALKEQLTNDRT
ncbi:MAG: hypothetical protein Tp170SUR191951_79 [Prokaryotic dsDNA virus sp.]|nr:MAG: hypothetical protein Tp170SUR191951_79 [Prokaryotic dsDNA virus sp.]|tara:strand:+ start:2058 stop:2204 length:147 start_codon:yes stop_codon:yes gene_type:complete